LQVGIRQACGTGILPVGLCGIGILPMLHGLEAHATLPQRSQAIALGHAPAGLYFGGGFR